MITVILQDGSTLVPIEETLNLKTGETMFSDETGAVIATGLDRAGAVRSLQIYFQQQPETQQKIAAFNAGQLGPTVAAAVALISTGSASAALASIAAGLKAPAVGG
jgi:hypothetical protein